MVAEVNGPKNGAIHNLVQSNGGPPRAGARGAALPATPGESVSVTGRAAALLALERVVAEAPEVDHERVARLREAIASGRYEIDYERTAARLIELEAAHPDRSPLE